MECLAPQFRWAPSPSAHAHHHPSPPSSSSRCSGLRVRCAVTSAAFDDAGHTNGCCGETLGFAYAAPDSASTLKEVTADPSAETAEEMLSRLSMKKDVHQALDTLTACEKQVVVMRFGLDVGRIRTLQEVSNIMGVSRGRIRQIESVALRKLSKKMETYDIMGDEGELNDNAQYTENIAVKSARQSERRARRTRAAIKAATSLHASEKKMTSSKKKRSKGPSSSMNPLGSLWKMTGRRLLTAKEEVEFSNAIQDLLKLKAIQAKLTEYSGGKPSIAQWATAAGIDEKTLHKRMAHGIYCHNRMITSNVGLVISIARDFEGLGKDLYDLIQDLSKLEAIQAELTKYNGDQPSFAQWATAAGIDEKTLRKHMARDILIAREFEVLGVDLYDLIQDGILALIRGVENFDASKGFKFSTYSYWCIKKAMRKSVLEQSQIIRMTDHVFEASCRVKKCTKRLRHKLKRRPTVEEIAIDTGLPVTLVEAALKLPKYSVSLYSKVGSTNMTYQEVITDPSVETTEEMLSKLLMKKDVHQAVDTLTAREKQVVVLRFGLDGGRLRTLQEIGNIMGVTRERIRQIESEALQKLRSKESVKALKEYLMPIDN